MLNYDKYHDLSYLIYVIAIGLGFILGFTMLHCFDVLAESVECQDIEDIVLETCNASKPSNIIKEMRNSENLQLYNAIELGNCYHYLFLLLKGMPLVVCKPVTSILNNNQ